VVVWRVRRRMI